MLSIASDLTLPKVLERVVLSACDLSGARYGALGVLRPDGRGLAEFIQVGMDEGTVEAIGHHPEGLGVLGELIRHPEPLRLPDVSEHPKFYGFPPHHPPLRSFLGVPIRVRGEAYGNLYLAEKEGAEEFTAEDEELVVALAAVAGTAIHNAHLYEETRQREQWLDAIGETIAVLLSGGDQQAFFDQACRSVRSLVNSDFASIAVPVGSHHMRLQAIDGESAADLLDSTYPVDRSLAGSALLRGRSVTTEDAATDERVHPVPEIDEFGPGMHVPLKVRGEAVATMSVARLRGRERFLAGDLRLVEAFADQMAVGMEFYRVQEELRRLAVVEDRERIARDLHDSIIQRLFATGLGIVGVAQRFKTKQPEVYGRLQEAAQDLDDSISQIRNTIFSLQAPGREDLRMAVLEMVLQSAETLGFVPEVKFEGAVDTLVPPEVAGHMLATLGEALSNVAKHARASQVDVTVEAGERLRLTVIDDGVGLPEGKAMGNGIPNMGERARRLGGEFTMAPGTDGGTALLWEVPLPRHL